MLTHIMLLQSTVPDLPIRVKYRIPRESYQTCIRHARTLPICTKPAVPRHCRGFRRRSAKSAYRCASMHIRFASYPCAVSRCRGGFDNPPSSASREVGHHRSGARAARKGGPGHLAQWIERRFVGFGQSLPRTHIDGLVKCTGMDDDIGHGERYDPASARPPARPCGGR